MGCHLTCAVGRLIWSLGWQSICIMYTYRGNQKSQDVGQVDKHIYNCGDIITLEILTHVVCLWQPVFLQPKKFCVDLGLYSSLWKIIWLPSYTYTNFSQGYMALLLGFLGCCMPVIMCSIFKIAVMRWLPACRKCVGIYVLVSIQSIS